MCCCSVSDCCCWFLLTFSWFRSIPQFPLRSADVEPSRFFSSAQPLVTKTLASYRSLYLHSWWRICRLPGNASLDVGVDRARCDDAASVACCRLTWPFPRRGAALITSILHLLPHARDSSWLQFRGSNLWVRVRTSLLFACHFVSQLDMHLANRSTFLNDRTLAQCEGADEQLLRPTVAPSIVLSPDSCSRKAVVRVTPVLLFTVSAAPTATGGGRFHLLSSMSSGRLSLLLSRSRTSQLCLVFEVLLCFFVDRVTSICRPSVALLGFV